MYYNEAAMHVKFTKKHKSMHINYILFAFSLLFLYTTIVIVHKTAERSLQGFPSANLTFPFVKRGSTHEYDTRRTLRKNS